MNTPETLCHELAGLCARVDRPMRFMEVCGTHTVSVFRSGIRSMLPPNLRLVSGPGCPVCVTAQRHIDAAIELASRPDLILATYGDMMRVPGRLGSLEKFRAKGARIRIVNSTRSALQLARDNPGNPVVFLAVGFETTAPVTAAATLEADKENIKNFSMLMCHKLVVPAMLALLEDGDVPLDGFLCPGHVSVIIGAQAYRPVVDRHNIPCVVAGFGAEQILTGLVHLVRQIVQGRAALENTYEAVVGEKGNQVAQALMMKVFEWEDTVWRELGVIPNSGLKLVPTYERFDAIRRFGIVLGEDENNPNCRCGEVIVGKVEPRDCELFGNGCTPLSPIGPCMVSSEGTCAAWYKYGQPVEAKKPKEFA